MPKEISHIHIAQQTLERLKTSGHHLLAQALENNLHTFYLGAIVPDALFYDVLTLRRVSRDYSRLRRILHSRDTAANDAKAVSLFSAIGSSPFEWPLKMALSAGIVTHTVSDRVIHKIIDYYTNRWRQKGSVVTATHRQFETLMDMVLLKTLNRSVRTFGLEGLAQVRRRHKHCVLAFYLSLVQDGEPPYSLDLLHILKRAFSQQLLFVRLFSINRLYHIVNILNNLAAGRLETWSYLFYPDTVGPETFPILTDLDVHTLTDGRTFSESIPALVQEISTEAASLICDGLTAL